MKAIRVLGIAALLVGGFWFVTTRAAWDWKRIGQPVAKVGELWREPDVARSAGLIADEVNNIEVYKAAREAVAYITSTTYRRGFFFEIQPVRELGSGFIISEDGRILTNNHVVSGSNQVEVTLPDQTTYKAQILVRDPSNDLALIKISPRKKLPVLKLGNSDTLQVGQKVLAIGNPYGFELTLTTGVISSIGRDIQGDQNTVLEGMIQTDASINSGNSGGPLLDSQGNVIGINTAIYTQSGGSVGIGFAMPINRAKAMLEDFASGRSFARPRIGVTVLYVAGDWAEALDLPARGGLLIQEVQRNSPAERAGLRGARQVVLIGNQQVGVGGDLIVAIDGKPADRPDAITRALARKRPGDTIELTVFRSGRNVNLRVTLGEVGDTRI